MGVFLFDAGYIILGAFSCLYQSEGEGHYSAVDNFFVDCVQYTSCW